ncbi:hypothetical protein ADEAN_000388500 [Angomonas deanei]|uniref:Uncharacterized protein n=1 Tax=Angomonas deanei TaxID=59799 RepID=A0A7G2CCI0_9TRYP|nr:hypothetical protein ADEAN_000388500 [Angomonas deanei]
MQDGLPTPEEVLRKWTTFDRNERSDVTARLVPFFIEKVITYRCGQVDDDLFREDISSWVPVAHRIIDDRAVVAEEKVTWELFEKLRKVLQDAETILEDIQLRLYRQRKKRISFASPIASRVRSVSPSVPAEALMCSQTEQLYAEESEEEEEEETSVARNSGTYYGNVFHSSERNEDDTLTKSKHRPAEEKMRGDHFHLFKHCTALMCISVIVLLCILVFQGV